MTANTMRSEAECLAKAAEMDSRANACSTAETRTSYIDLAEGWRSVSRQAAWQQLYHSCGGGDSSLIRP
jgi:hypothetical protein